MRTIFKNYSKNIKSESILKNIFFPVYLIGFSSLNMYCISDGFRKIIDRDMLINSYSY